MIRCLLPFSNFCKIELESHVLLHYLTTKKWKCFLIFQWEFFFQSLCVDCNVNRTIHVLILLRNSHCFYDTILCTYYIVSFSLQNQAGDSANNFSSHSKNISSKEVYISIKATNPCRRSFSLIAVKIGSKVLVEKFEDNQILWKLFFFQATL